jgi:hypothetical protein
MKNIVFLIMFLFSSCANGDSFIVLQERETYDLRIGERDGIVQVGCILWRDKVIFFPIEKGQEIRFSEISGLNIFAKTSVSEHKMSKAGIYILRKDKSIVYSSSTDLFKRVKNDCVWLDSNGEESSARL